MNQKTLYLGTAPRDVHPDAAVMAGPWCLHPLLMQAAGEAPERDVTDAFLMPPEVFADPQRLEIAVQQTRHLVATCAATLQEQLNRHYGVTHDARYWDFLLAPWLTRVAETLTDRLHRAASLLESFGEGTYTVPILPDTCRFPFADTQHFIMSGILNPEWNQWLLSRILERVWPASWKMSLLDPVSRPLPPAHSESFLKRRARSILFGLPFPRVKGFTTTQSCTLSLTLLANRTRQDDTLSLRDLDVTSAPPLPLGWSDKDAVAFICALLPESLRNASIPSRLPLPLIRTRVASVAACEDDAYRLRLAAHRGAGCRMLFIQHGGEYGFVRSSAAYPLVEYRQHRFITWGWSHHGTMPGHFLPLPHPQLAALRGAHLETSPTLILVGTEMALLPYTLKSMLRGRQFFDYRKDKARFFAALPPEIRQSAQYRPYFDIPTSLPDAPWLLHQFPEVKRCTGPLEPHLFGCRLLILDHAGTTLAQALAADIPFILFMRPETASFTPEALPLLNGLRKAGILHDSPESAAAQATRIWHSVPAWWQTTRDARIPWASQHALTIDTDVLPLWKKALRNV